MQWNGLTSSRQLRAGMRFYIKPPSKAVKNSGKTVLAKNISRKVIKGKHRVIRVRNGDTLWGIAKMYRTTVKKLVVLNELKSGSHLRPTKNLLCLTVHKRYSLLFSGSVPAINQKQD